MIYKVFICAKTLSMKCVKDRIFKLKEAAEKKAAEMTNEFYAYHVNAAYCTETEEFVGYIVNPDGMGRNNNV